MHPQKVLLTYFDILGFRDLVNRSRTEEVAKVLSAFKRLSEPPSGETKTWNVVFSNFSDLAVRAIPIRSRPEFEGAQGLLFWELLDLAFIQANLVEKGVFVRGAVTVGDLYSEDGLIFGPALIRAYELENTVALYPRIILDSRVFDRLRDTVELRSSDSGDASQEFPDILSKDNDNVWFVDYLRAKRAELQDDDARFLQFTNEHKRIIIKTSALFPELDSRSVKLAWAANYHNRFILGLPNRLFSDQGSRREDFLIDQA